MSQLQGYTSVVWERRPFYVAHTGVISTFTDPDEPATEAQLKLAESLGVEITEMMRSSLSMAEVNQLIYVAAGGERFVAMRGSIEREYEARRHELRDHGTKRQFTEVALGKALSNPHGPPSKRALHSLNARGVLRIADSPTRPWSQGELIRLVKRLRSSTSVAPRVAVVSELRLLNALGGLDVDIENGAPLDKDEVLDAIELRLPTEIAERHMQLWGYARQ